MAEKEIILTQEGLQKLEQELEELKTVRRREVAERIKQALEFGDISENSEYDDAKNEQAFIEGRILTLEKMLRNARVMDSSDVSKDKVTLGSRVKIRDLGNSEVLEFTLVSSAEANLAEQKISNESPVGQALLGHHVGDVVQVSVPDGKIEYKIEEVRLA
ncbi:MAG: transcription elongation factor GreA [Firmicutes bacterium]|nr:transcription elongation factor GreA [Bacillota bacterium]